MVGKSLFILPGVAALRVEDPKPQAVQNLGAQYVLNEVVNQMQKELNLQTTEGDKSMQAYKDTACTCNNNQKDYTDDAATAKAAAGTAQTAVETQESNRVMAQTKRDAAETAMNTARTNMNNAKAAKKQDMNELNVQSAAIAQKLSDCQKAAKVLAASLTSDGAHGDKDHLMQQGQSIGQSDSHGAVQKIKDICSGDETKTPRSIALMLQDKNTEIDTQEAYHNGEIQTFENEMNQQSSNFDTESKNFDDAKAAKARAKAKYDHQISVERENNILLDQEYNNCNMDKKNYDEKQEDRSMNLKLMTQLITFMKQAFDLNADKVDLIDMSPKHRLSFLQTRSPFDEAALLVHKAADEFHSTQLSTLAMNMGKSSGSLTMVVKMVEDLIRNMENEVQEKQGTHEKCTDQQQQLAENIKRATDAFHAAQKQVQEETDESDDLAAEIMATRKNNFKLSNKLRKATSLRHQEQQANNKNIKTSNDGIFALTQVKSAMAGVIHSGSESFDDGSREMKRNDEYSADVKMDDEGTYTRQKKLGNGDGHTDGLKAVAGMVDAALARFSDSKTKSMKIEREQHEAYDEKKNTLQKALNKGTTDNEDLQGQLTDSQTAQGTAFQAYNTAFSTLETLNAENKNWQSTCEVTGWMDNYGAAKAAREAEIKALENARKILEGQ